MTGNWSLDSIELTDTNVTVFVTEKPEERGVRVAETSLEAGGEDLQFLGRDKGRTTLTFVVLGRGLAAHELVSLIRGKVESGATWTLTAPEGDHVYAYDVQQTSRLRTVGRVQVSPRNQVSTEISVPTAFLGDPAMVPETLNLEVEYLSNEHYATTGTAGFDGTMRAWLPAQATGYPRAQDTSTGVFEVVSGDWAYTASLIDGTTATITSYALTGYVHGTPIDDGDGGPAVLQRRDS